MSAHTIMTGFAALITKETTRIVSNGPKGNCVAILPEIDDGSGDSVAVGAEIEVEARAAEVELQTKAGHRVGLVRPFNVVTVVARASAKRDAEHGVTRDTWQIRS